jgi:hypothetical protein
MQTSQRRLLFVGYPDASEISQWAAVRAIAVQQGWQTTRTYTPGNIACAVVSENVLDGVCSPTEATLMQKLHADDVRCASAIDAVIDLFASAT